MFNFKLTGIGSINKDYKHFNTEVHKATQLGVKTFASELTPCLQKHIQKDVYDAYTPSYYVRRHDYPEYGRSIYDSENMQYNFINNGRGVEFTYEPNDGKNTYPNFVKKELPYYVDGDSIINVIQENAGYLWVDRITKKRPFWDNFVQEVGSQSDEWFTKGFNEYNHNLQAQADRNITDETNDYKLEPTGELTENY